jgi:protein-S-isoprenylcysteine O-methyltransferase Ste14
MFATTIPQAYDRIAAPEQLVTSGVYRFVQHPIYTSYMLLFCGFCLCVHSAPSALLMLAVCTMYYRCVRSFHSVAEGLMQGDFIGKGELSRLTD